MNEIQGFHAQDRDQVKSLAQVRRSSRYNASGTFQLQSPSCRKYLPVHGDERVRLESELREHGFQESKCCTIWEIISDYRNRLVICFVVVFVLAGLVAILAVKHWGQKPSALGYQGLHLPVDEQKNHHQSASHSNHSSTKKVDNNTEGSNSGHSHSSVMPDTVKEPALKGESTQKTPDVVLINSWKEIQTLNESVVAIRIKALGNRVGLIPLQHPESNTNVHTLILDAKIPEDDVNQLLMQLPNVTKLVLNMDELCDGSKHISPIETTLILNITSVETLRLVNCYDCPIVDWILKSKVKLVKRLELCNCEVNKRMHDLIKKFMHQPQGEYKVKIGMLGQNNELCKECVFDNEELVAESENVLEERESDGDAQEPCFR